MKSNFPTQRVQQNGLISPAVVDLTDRNLIPEAIDVLGGLWEGYESIPESENADHLLALGIVMSVGGMMEQSVGAQERAKNLYSKAARLSDGYIRELADVGMGYAYWREGAAESGLIVVDPLLDSDNVEIRFRAYFCRSVLLADSDREAALESLKMVASLLDEVSLALQGKYHGQRALILQELADASDDTDIRDRAIVEYEAASVAFETVGNIISEATVTNNLAGLYLSVGQHTRAHVNVDRGISLLTRLGDKGRLALAYDQKARIYLAEKQFDSAVKMAERAVKIVKGDEYPQRLAECQKTLDTARGASATSESAMIRHALEVTGGATSKAAQLLGLTQPGLAFKIENQYPELRSLRKAPRTISHRPTKHSRKK